MKPGKLPERTANTLSDAIALSSPSGRTSKRAHAAARARLRQELFGPNGLPGPQAPEQNERESLLRQAAELRRLAAGGMKPRAYARKAAELEAQAAALETQDGSHHDSPSA